jgi:hypothetical protein
MVDSSGPAIALDKLAFIVSLAREFDVKVAPEEPDPEAGPDEDDMVSSVLEDCGDDPAEEELRTFIDELDEDEQIDLVALVWLGRGDGEPSDWDGLRSEAERAHNDRTAEYLMGMPLLADYLEEGMNALGLSGET